MSEQKLRAQWQNAEERLLAVAFERDKYQARAITAEAQVADLTAQRDAAIGQRDLLGQALGGVLVKVGVMEEVGVTGPELLMCADTFLALHTSQDPEGD